MKKVFVLALVVLMGYYAWQKLFSQPVQIEALYETPYVVVYGRDSCGWTQKYIKDLSDRGVNYIYKRVNEEDVSNELHPRMDKAGLDTSFYYLPVIDVNAHIFIRPEMETLLETYESI